VVKPGKRGSVRAHHRRPRVKNEGEIRSLCDAKVAIIARGKANAEVEFGNKLSLVESWDGMILHYQLHAEPVAESKLLAPCATTLKAKAIGIRKVWTDRGLCSRSEKPAEASAEAKRGKNRPATRSSHAQAARSGVGKDHKTTASR
jgi:hypothetical protein